MISPVIGIDCTHCRCPQRARRAQRPSLAAGREKVLSRSRQRGPGGSQPVSQPLILNRPGGAARSHEQRKVGVTPNAHHNTANVRQQRAARATAAPEQQRGSQHDDVKREVIFSFQDQTVIPCRGFCCPRAGRGAFGTRFPGPEGAPRRGGARRRFAPIFTCRQPFRLLRIPASVDELPRHDGATGGSAVRARPRHLEASIGTRRTRSLYAARGMDQEPFRVV